MNDERAMPTLRLNLALIPPVDVGDQLVIYAQELLPAGAPYVLDGKSYFPHLSLYMTDVLCNSQEEFLKIARKVYLSVEVPLQCLADSIALSAGNYVEISYSKTNQIVRAHLLAVKHLHHLSSIAESGISNRPGRRRNDNVNRYGYELVGDLFRPHVTLGKLRNFDALCLNPPSITMFDFEATRLGVFAADINGAAVDLLWAIR